MGKIKKHINNTPFGMYFLIYYLIIGSDCILFCFNQNQALVSLGQYVMVAISAFFLFRTLIKSKGKVGKKYLFLFVTIVSLFFTAVYYGEFSGGYISLIALLILGNTFFDNINAKVFKNVFINLMTIICVVSLITYFFASACLKLPLFPSIYNTLGREYRFFFFSNISLIDPTRNYGVFTEPSRFQAYINLCLIFLMFDQEKKLDIKRIGLFIVTLLTTLSTAGFIAFAIIMIAFVLSSRVQMKAIYKGILIFCFSAAILFMFFSNEKFAWAILKVTAGQSDRSASTRFNSFFASLINIYRYFPLGTGIQNADRAFFEALDLLGNPYASTNTITVLIYFSKFGFIVGLYYVVNMMKAIRNMCNGGSTLYLIVAFVAMTSGITMIESIIFSIIVFYPQTSDVRNVEWQTSTNNSYGININMRTRWFGGK